PWTGVTLFVAVLAYVGCSSTTTPDLSSSPAAAPGRGTDTGAASAAKKDSSDGGGKVGSHLGDPPAVLIRSGPLGYFLDPRGCCPEEKFGGLIRRYDFVERLHTQNHWPTALIDLGSLTRDPAVARGGFEQAKLKFDYALKALKLLKYNALALSAEDLKVG